MKTLLLPAAAALTIALATTAFAQSPAVYTAGQAHAGEQLYAAQCSSCHGAALRGGAGPALVGDAFTAQWTGEPASDPYRMMITNMPLASPGSLKPAEYLAIMAYVLQRNGFPAGRRMLTSDTLRHLTLQAPVNK